MGFENKFFGWASDELAWRDLHSGAIFNNEGVEDSPNVVVKKLKLVWAKNWAPTAYSQLHRQMDVESGVIDPSPSGECLASFRPPEMFNVEFLGESFPTKFCPLSVRMVEGIPWRENTSNIASAVASASVFFRGMASGHLDAKSINIDFFFGPLQWANHIEGHLFLWADPRDQTEGSTTPQDVAVLTCNQRRKQQEQMQQDQADTDRDGVQPTSLDTTPADVPEAEKASSNITLGSHSLLDLVMSLIRRQLHFSVIVMGNGPG